MDFPPICCARATTAMSEAMGRCLLPPPTLPFFLNIDSTPISCVWIECLLRARSIMKAIASGGVIVCIREGALSLPEDAAPK